MSIYWRRFKQQGKKICWKKKRKKEERTLNGSSCAKIGLGRDQELRQHKGVEEPVVLPPLHAFLTARPLTRMKTRTGMSQLQKEGAAAANSGAARELQGSFSWGKLPGGRGSLTPKCERERENCMAALQLQASFSSGRTARWKRRTCKGQTSTGPKDVSPLEPQGPQEGTRSAWTPPNQPQRHLRQHSARAQPALADWEQAVRGVQAARGSLDGATHGAESSTGATGGRVSQDTQRGRRRVRCARDEGAAGHSQRLTRTSCGREGGAARRGGRRGRGGGGCSA